MEQRHTNIDIATQRQPQLDEQPHQPGVVIGHGVIVASEHHLADCGDGVPGQNAGIPGQQKAQIDEGHGGKDTPEHPLGVLPLPGVPPQGQPPQHTKENLIPHAEAAQQIHHNIQPVLQGSGFINLVVAQHHRHGKQTREAPQGRAAFSALSVVPEAQQRRHTQKQVHTVIGVRSGQSRQIGEPDIDEQRLRRNGKA